MEPVWVVEKWEEYNDYTRDVMLVGLFTNARAAQVTALRYHNHFHGTDLPQLRFERRGDASIGYAPGDTDHPVEYRIFQMKVLDDPQTFTLEQQTGRS